MITNHYKVAFLIVVLSCSWVQCNNNSTIEVTETPFQAMQYNGERLNRILSNYDRKIRPNIYGPATNVEVEMKVVSFGPVHESEQSYQLDIYFRQWWQDPVIRGAVNRSLTLAVDVGDLIWKPDTYFVNAMKASFKHVTKDTMRVVLKPDGSVYYSARIALKLSCPMDFSLYPMDTQACPMLIESYSYTKEEVFYSWHESVGKLRKTKGVEWIATDGPVFKLVDVTSEQKFFSNNSKGSYSKLNVTFHLKRRHGYYVWQTYLPSSFLVLMTWVNFWIPASAYPARVTVCVTSFLSTLLVMSSSASQITRVSYVKAIDYFLMGNAIFIFLSLLEYVVVLHSWWDLSLKFWKKKRTLSFSEITDAKEIHVGFDNPVMKRITESGKEGIELNESLRRREIPTTSTINNSNSEQGAATTREKNERKKPCCCSSANGMIDEQMFFISCSLRDSEGNPCKQCQKKDRTWYEKTGKSHPADVLSRVLFPISYIIFFIVYCVSFNLI